MMQWEKMLGGELFQTDDPEIEERYNRCQRLLFMLKNCDPANTELQNDIKRQLFKKFGKTLLTTPFYCEFGVNITFSGFAVINYNNTFVDYAPISIGAETYFAPGVVLNTLCRPTDPELRRKRQAFAKPITIEKDVWLGTDTVVMPGVTIGERSIIGAGSVVTCDIPPDVVAFGKPCRVMRPLTDRDREKLPE